MSTLFVWLGSVIIVHFCSRRNLRTGYYFQGGITGLPGNFCNREMIQTVYQWEQDWHGIILVNNFSVPVHQLPGETPGRENGRSPQV